MPQCVSSTVPMRIYFGLKLILRPNANINLLSTNKIFNSFEFRNKISWEMIVLHKHNSNRLLNISLCTRWYRITKKNHRDKVQKINYLMKSPLFADNELKKLVFLNSLGTLGRNFDKKFWFSNFGTEAIKLFHLNVGSQTKALKSLRVCSTPYSY